MDATLKTMIQKKTMKSILSVCASMLLAVSAQAADAENPYKKSYKVTLPKDVHPIYMGIGLSNELMHLMIQKPTTVGNFYARVGQFYDGEDIAGQVGYRYPYKLTGKNNNGVYVGVFGGHVESERDFTDPNPEEQRYNRLGVGADLSYVWFDKTRISSLSVGLYVPEKTKLYNGTKAKSEPAVMFSFDIAAGLF